MRTYRIQCTGNLQHLPELVCKPNDLVLENNAPSLVKIMQAHDRGENLDASLWRDMPYNDIEHNPFHEKGLDLADLPRIAKMMNEGMEELQTQIEAEKRARNTPKTPDQSETPTPVSSEPSD